MEADSDYDRAVCRVEEKLGFYVHLAAYLLVNTLLIAINFAKTPQELWFYWPLGGWGIGIALHAWRVLSGPTVSRLKQRMIQRELRRRPSLPADESHRTSA
jgi:hypothetical protein